MAERKIKIHLLNNEGAGFSNTIEVVDGATVGDVVKMHVTSKPESYKIHLNRDATTADAVLKEGDRIVITPQKVAGA